MEDFIEQHYYMEPLESNDEYEFDACRFFDFTRPEFDSEIEEAERWFEISGYYPPSRGNNHGTEKEKTKPCDKLYRSRSSTFMKPTASHLAKQNKTHDKHSSHHCTRFQRASSKIDEKGLQSPALSDNLATKRQKLDIGFLKKIAQLKHRVSLSHKSSKKLTVPKEPELETLLRAQRRRSKNSSVSSGSDKQKPKDCISKTRSLNTKFVQAPPLPPCKKSKPQVPKTQVFHLKTTERANRGGFCKVYPSEIDTYGVRDVKQKGTTLTESSSVNKASKSPPIEQFSKLSLGSDDNKADEDGFDSFKPELWRCHAKPNQCGGHIRVHEVERWSNMNMRSLGIR